MASFSPITFTGMGGADLVTGPGPADERRHPPGRGRRWEESWYLDFVHGDGRLAGYVRLTLRPGEGTAWFWAAVVGRGPALVTLRDHEVGPPPGRSLEVRAPGLWTELVCETPLEHWSVGMEAFGVALDDPLEAWGQERGDPWALGLDVEWEATGPCEPWAGEGQGYWQPSQVSGDVLVGAERFQLDGSGTRLHRWGDPGRARPSGWAAGAADGGPPFLATDLTVESAPSGLLRSVRGAGVEGSAVAASPVLLPGEGRLARALCHYGAGGRGWAEWFTPGGGSAPA